MESPDEPREIGKVVGSNDHSDYVVQVHASGEVENPPAPADRAFGTFVEIAVDAEYRLIGIIYTTQLVNPAYGTLGPRLSTEQEIPVFSPDYLAETATLLGISIVGTARKNGQRVEWDQRTPTLAGDLDAPARRLASADFLAFHRPAGKVQVAYFPRLLARPFPGLPDLLCAILDKLIGAFPDEAARLSVARQNIRWRAAIPAR
ncbi:MAG TPA: hypothetical protein VMW65_10935 [Chloroflexota bacterium]|nr:hypothetical protein [Chloroflexota bacterium]